MYFYFLQMNNSYPIVIIKDRKFKGDALIPVIVPSEYIKTNSQLQSFVRYMPPPYKEEDKLLIQEFVTKRLAPPESWPSYKCETKVVVGMINKLNIFFLEDFVSSKSV